VAVAGLDHEDHPLADARLQLLGEVAADDDTGVRVARQVAPDDDLGRQVGDLAFARRRNPQQSDRARAVFALHDSRHTHARRPGADQRRVQGAEQGAVRGRHPACDARVLEVAGRVNLGLAGEQAQGGLAAPGGEGLQHDVEGQDRPHPDRHHDERDQGAARVAPQVAPRQRSQEADHAPLMARAGVRRSTRR
jgi:hypothetical protein